MAQFHPPALQLPNSMRAASGSEEELRPRLGVELRHTELRAKLTVQAAEAETGETHQSVGGDWPAQGMHAVQPEAMGKETDLFKEGGLGLLQG